MTNIVPALDRIQALNDMLRQTFIGGKILLSAGVASLDEETQHQLLNAVKFFNDFTDDNDPYGEHDCAIVSWEEYRVLFKISYYDPTLTYHSDDPADSRETVRVMTVMFPEEY